MPAKPASEIRIDDGVIRALLASQAVGAVADAATRPLMKVAEGWDSEMWRLGDDLAVRMPRRAAAAPLLRNEQRVLPDLARRLRAAGVTVPAPIVAGHPTASFPWPWSVVPWIEGSPVHELPRPERSAWARQLAAGLMALHAPAPSDFPVNPVRGRPLATRDAIFRERLEALREARMLDDDLAQALSRAWQRGLETPPWPGEPVWIHGDLHPGNLVAREGLLAGIIDFGDVTAGDPAYDLAVAWLAFDAAGRHRFVSAIGERSDYATWRRARAWAAAVSVMLLTHSDDSPAYVEFARDTAAELAAEDRV